MSHKVPERSEWDQLSAKKFSSLLHCLNKRKTYIGNLSGWDWVFNDPVVGCFAPAMYQLEKDGLIQLSTEEKTSFENLYWQNTGLNIKRQHKLEPILSDLDDQNIDVLPLKGAALLETIYKNIGLRVMTDIDILVRHEDFLQTAILLLRSGLKPKWSYPFGELLDFTSLPEKYWPGELSFYDGRYFHLDLHRDLVTYHWFKVPFPLEMENIWERVIQIYENGVIDDKPLWKTHLSPYDMLIHMCLHLALHGLQIMKNFWDVDLFIRNLPEDWDWKTFLVIAEKSCLKSTSYHTFIFCQELFETPIPEDVIYTLQPSGFDRWQVRRLISSEKLISAKESLGIHFPTLVKFALFEDTCIKLKTMKNLIIPDSDWLKNNSEGRSVISHWGHLLKVFLRGD